MADAPAPKRRQPTIRGGFIVHRRGDASSRIMTPPRRLVFEHGSLEAARAEAARLSQKHKREFVVFQEVATVPAPGDDAAQTGEAL